MENAAGAHVELEELSEAEEAAALSGGEQADDEAEVVFRRRDDVDGLRGVAVCCVVAFHLSASRFAAGFVGVDVFFVVSGFVVTSAVLRRRAARDATEYATLFYARRATRLAPALLSCTVCVAIALRCVASAGEHRDASIALNTAVAAVAGSSNVYLGAVEARDRRRAERSDGGSVVGYFGDSWGADDAPFAHDVRKNPFAHTWSLGVEEQFYLVFPWLLVLAYGERVLLKSVKGAPEQTRRRAAQARGNSPRARAPAETKRERNLDGSEECDTRSFARKPSPFE